MKNAHDPSIALQDIHFSDINQYVDEVLSAFGIPRSTISRLLSMAEAGGFSQPMYVYQRAALVYEKETIDTVHISEYEKKLEKKYRLLVIISADLIVCKDAVSGEVIVCKPAEISKHVAAFTPLIYGSANEKDLKVTTDFSELVAGLYNQLTLDEHNAQLTSEVTDYILALIYISFSKSVTHDNEIAKFFNHVIASRDDNYKNIINLFFAAISAPGQRSNIYEQLPYFGAYSLTDNVTPAINAKSFELSANVLCFDLKEIDPEVLGSLVYKMTQDVTGPSIYGHQTTTENVSKVLDPLFVNRYERRINDNRDNPEALLRIKDELLEITFFDPTNGPGCFLSSALNGVRRLLGMISEFTDSDIGEIQLGRYVGLLDNKLALQLSHLTLWVCYLQFVYDTKRIVNRADLNAAYEAIDLTLGNQLESDWQTVCPNRGTTLIIGSPMFKGANKQSSADKDMMRKVFGTQSVGGVDYSASWLYKAAEYIHGTTSESALVLTNSVCQGEQVPFLWSKIYDLGCDISFAHRSFKWKNSSSSSIGVSVIIVGLVDEKHQQPDKYLYAANQVVKTDTIGPYLINSTKVIVKGRTKLLSPTLPEMKKGNMPYDEQNLLLSKEEKDMLVEQYPAAQKYLKRIVGSKEFINGLERWCLWIPDDDMSDALTITEIADRVKKVEQFRLGSTDGAAKKLGLRPHQFREFRSTHTQTLIVPSVSSENRAYIPIGFVGKNTIISNLAFAIYDCEPWIFGLISSRMHLAWIRTVCGSHETRIRYSSELGYNTFPFPAISEEQKQRIEALVFDIIGERENYCDQPLGDLYSDLPEKLKMLHKYLDDEIDACYQVEPFRSDVERVKLLLRLYSEAKG